ncbi:hypothetical protein AMECASPLE_018271 [Ameca splendens]|uniref:Uncharacterized protein n=1 Tax=Ameca splendens TaxID=208324 RepID=A0ABV0Y354_9TELE
MIFLVPVIQSSIPALPETHGAPSVHFIIMSCIPWNSLSGLFVVPDQTPYFSSFSLSHTLLSFCDPHPSAAYPLMVVMAQAPTASSWAVFPDLSVFVPFDQSVLVFAGRQSIQHQHWNAAEEHLERT